MTNFKKCEYCHYRRSDTKRYKTSNNFLDGKVDHECGNIVKTIDQSTILDLCDVCYDTIIPEDARLSDRKISQEWYAKNEIGKLLNKRWRGIDRIAFKLRPS